jgi:hypothetical protein
MRRRAVMLQCSADTIRNRRAKSNPAATKSHVDA